MGIPYWREVGYTDEGCSEFQCLSCKKKWEGRTLPGYINYECGKCTLCTTGKFAENHSGWDCYGKEEFAVYKPYFVYCPCCGVKWVGEMKRPKNHRKAIVERILQNGPFEYTASKPKSHWVLEEKAYHIDGYGKYTPYWRMTRRYDLSRYSSREIFRVLLKHREEERECKDELGQLYDETKYRIRIAHERC